MIITDTIWAIPYGHLLEPNLRGSEDNGRVAPGQLKFYQWCILGHPDSARLGGIFLRIIGKWGPIHQRFIDGAVRFLGKNIGSLIRIRITNG
jgi:hypothetical protein